MPKRQNIIVQRNRYDIRTCGCGFKTASKIVMKLHQKHVHADTKINTIIRCEICKKVFKDEKEKKEHSNSHDRRLRVNQI